LVGIIESLAGKEPLLSPQAHSNFRIILYWKRTSFQDRYSIGKCLPVENAPPAVVLAVGACFLGRQVRPKRRHRAGEEKLPALPRVEQGQFRDVKTGVLSRPGEGVENSILEGGLLRGR
jgi:hypothetical protein